MRGQGEFRLLISRQFLGQAETPFRMAAYCCAVVVYLLDFDLFRRPIGTQVAFENTIKTRVSPFAEKVTLKKFSGAYNPSDAVMNRGLARRE
jgi:hypothetical protein